MTKSINRLVQEVHAESNFTLVRSQRIAIAKAIATGMQLAGILPAMKDEANRIVGFRVGDPGDTDSIE